MAIIRNFDLNGENINPLYETDMEKEWYAYSTSSVL